MSEIKFGSDFFEDPDILKAYLSSRHRSNSPNETLEKPIFLQLLGEVKGKLILDLGCGDGMFALELFEAGCRNYLGIDASKQMVRIAKTVLMDRPANIVHSKIESLEYPTNQFDLVISRLALHYVENIHEVFKKYLLVSNQMADLFFLSSIQSLHLRIKAGNLEGSEKIGS